jgi:hypothetical protein
MVRRVFPYAVASAVVGAIVAGLVLIGPPTVERMRRLDDIRVRDLTQLSHAVDLYWQREEKLPPSLDALAGAPSVPFRSTTDPSTSEPYAYRALDATHYELCATFEAEDVDGDYNDRFWVHGAGRRCFELNAEKQRPR